MTEHFERIANELLDNSISISDGLFDDQLIESLKQEAVLDFENGEFHKAQVGKGVEKQRITELRSDKVKWLDSDYASEDLSQYWSFVTSLRQYLSEFFRIHLERTELHFAVYPQGSFYTKHVDQFQAHGDRVFSIILYLNTEWKPGDGGELRVYNPDGSTEDHPPLGNRLVVFRSDVVEHEVLISNNRRVSITGWIRRDELIF